MVRTEVPTGQAEGPTASLVEERDTADVTSAALRRLSAGLAGASSPVLRTTGLTKAFGKTTAVEGLDLELVGGQVVGFLGPNGAGKTTVLRMLTGALQTGGEAKQVVNAVALQG